MWQTAQCFLCKSGATSQVIVEIVDWQEKKGGKREEVKREVRETDTKAREEEKIYILVTNWFLKG